MAEVELKTFSNPSVIPSSDDYILLLNQKFGAHTNSTLVASLKRNYEKLSENNKIKFIEGLRTLDDVEEGISRLPLISGGKTRQKRNKRKMRRNKTKRKR